MKTYSLAPIKSQAVALEALNAILPGQSAPWILKDKDETPIAYIALEQCEVVTGDYEILADISGRHHNKDADIVLVLEEIKKRTGGEITCHP